MIFENYVILISLTKKVNLEMATIKQINEHNQLNEIITN